MVYYIQRKGKKPEQRKRERKMRQDLINAKEYKIGIKFTGEIYRRVETYKSLEEALKKFNEYKNKGYEPTIRGVK